MARGPVQIHTLTKATLFLLSLSHNQMAEYVRCLLRR